MELSLAVLREPKVRRCIEEVQALSGQRYQDWEQYQRSERHFADAVQDLRQAVQDVHEHHIQEAHWVKELLNKSVEPISSYMAKHSGTREAAVDAALRDSHHAAD